MIRTVFIFSLLLIFSSSNAQQITGVWEGKINGKKVELKIVQKGDSITGNSYYYESGRIFRRYSIKGYFDSKEYSVVWWDEKLVQDLTSKSIFGPSMQNALRSEADFSCPGGDKLWLNGSCAPVDDPTRSNGIVALQKTQSPKFPDEWDYIIENYTAGANDPFLIDSVSAIAGIQPPPETKTDPPALLAHKKTSNPVTLNSTPEKLPVQKVQGAPIEKSQSIEEKMTSRKKIITTEIPLAGDSIELRFYDNAEIDGDSISLFLNDKLIFEHIRLSDTAYIVKLPVSELQNHNELIMVAENLGSIPPNTSFMVAIVENKRYEARLESTEQTSAVIKFLPPNSSATTPR